jgi:uncharacterized protein (DUF2141 family)
LHRFLSFCLLILIATTLPAETFRNPRRIPTPAQISTVIVGDINNDGRPDILYGTGEFSASTLHPLIAQSNGIYLPGTDITLPLPIGPRCKLADLNADHNLDLICGSDTSEEIAVFLGNGDGTFQTAITISLGSATSGTRLTIAATGDVDNDGHQDIIVTDATNTRVVVLLGDGTGHATLKSSLADGGYPLLAVHDLNGDGNLDLITQGAAGADIGVFLGHGDGTFATAVFYPNNFSSVLGDADGDGHVDLIGGGDGQLTILHGNPDGTFAPTPIASVNYSSPSFLKTGFASYLSAYAYLDLNGDRIPDILARGDDGLTVILGKPGLQFAPPVHYPVAQDFFLDDFFDSNTLVDMDGDGNPDFISAGPNGVYITYGRADGSFASANVYESGTVDFFATVADFNEDKNPDVVTTGTTQLQLNFGKADGTFSPATSIPGTVVYNDGNPGISLTHIVHGDFNGDGHQDLITIGLPAINTTVPYLLSGHGDGTFSSPVALSTQIAVTDQSTVGDFNHDGRDDIAVLSTSTQPASLVVFLSQPDGSFSPVTTNLQGVTGEATSSHIAFADLNHDGILDLAYATTNHLFIMIGQGNGTFSSPSSLPVPPISGASSQSPGTVTIGDFDGDGKPDLALLIPYSRAYGDITESPTQIDVFYNDGFPSFSSPVTGTTSFHSYTQFTSSDLNQDGLSDLIYSNGGNLYAGGSGPNIGIIHGLPNRTLSSETNYVAGTGLSSIFIVDLNHDGMPDILASNGDYNDTANSFTVLLNQGNAPAVQGTLTAAPEPSLINQSVTVTATLQPPTSSAPIQLSGTVTFTIDGNPAGSSALNNNTASVIIPAPLTVGIHHLAASWPGMANSAGTFDPVTLSADHTVTQIISRATTTTTIAANPNPAYVSQTVTLAAAVNSPIGTPTGTIQFFDGATPLTTVSLTSGTASFATALLTPGDHSITAQYSGDANNLPSTSSPITETVLPSDFTLSIDPSSLTLITGHHTTLTLIATSVGSFADTIHLTIGSLPQWTNVAFTPIDLTLTAGGKATTKVYVDTDAVIGYISQTQPKRTPFSTAIATTLALLVLPFTNRRARRLPTLIALAITAALLIGATGCSGMYPGSTTPGTYTLQITATAKQIPIAHTLDLPLTVTK